MKKLFHFFKTALKKDSDPVSSQREGEQSLVEKLWLGAQKRAGTGREKALKAFSQRAVFTIALILVSFIVNFTFINHPNRIKKWLSKIYQKPREMTLQRANAHLTASDMDIRVIKVKRKNNIYLEFLSHEADGSYRPINKVKLKGRRNGYFQYSEETASLGIQDIDGDGYMDVIAPTFNRFFVPYLNIVFYNQKKRQFELQPEPRWQPQVIDREE